MVEALRGIRQTGQEVESPNETVSLGQRIRTQREHLGMSQVRFSLEISLSQGFLSQIENDEYGFGHKQAISIAQALGVGINFFEGGHDKEVFLMPQARRLHQILSSPLLDNEPRKVIKDAIRKLIPQVESPRIGYIETVSRKRKIGPIVYDERALVMTQGELAQRSNLSQGYLSQLESGDVENPSLHTLRKISEALNIDLYRFLGIRRTVYPGEIEKLDGFLRSDHFTAGQKAVILNRLIQIVAIIQPLVNRIDPVPQELQIK